MKVSRPSPSLGLGVSKGIGWKEGACVCVCVAGAGGGRVPHLGVGVVQLNGGKRIIQPALEGAHHDVRGRAVVEERRIGRFHLCRRRPGDVVGNEEDKRERKKGGEVKEKKKRS